MSEAPRTEVVSTSPVTLQVEEEIPPEVLERIDQITQTTAKEIERALTCSNSGQKSLVLRQFQIHETARIERRLLREAIENSKSETPSAVFIDNVGKSLVKDGIILEKKGPHGKGATTAEVDTQTLTLRSRRFTVTDEISEELEDFHIRAKVAIDSIEDQEIKSLLEKLAGKYLGEAITIDPQLLQKANKELEKIKIFIDQRRGIAILRPTYGNQLPLPTSVRLAAATPAAATPAAATPAAATPAAATPAAATPAAATPAAATPAAATPAAPKPAPAPAAVSARPLAAPARPADLENALSRYLSRHQRQTTTAPAPRPAPAQTRPTPVHTPAPTPARPAASPPPARPVPGPAPAKGPKSCIDILIENSSALEDDEIFDIVTCLAKAADSGDTKGYTVEKIAEEAGLDKGSVLAILADSDDLKALNTTLLQFGLKIRKHAKPVRYALERIDGKLRSV